MVATSYTVELRRIIPASPSRVFEAWTDPQILSRWFAPSREYNTVVHQADVRVGGRYRIEMQRPDGGSSIVIGEYREVSPPTRLAFTWQWEGKPMQETLVAVEFQPNGASTEVSLTHTLFTTEEQREQHNKGWTGCMSCLEAFVQA
jgi:uncharacterized protein YndB with AHSA1/START domain